MAMFLLLMYVVLLILLYQLTRVILLVVVVNGPVMITFIGVGILATLLPLVSPLVSLQGLL
jgi:hypothetical protein